MTEKPTTCSWVTPEEATPEEGELVLHTYVGIRSPQYGRYARGKFWRNSGPEVYAVSHWLRIPPINDPLLANDLTSNISTRYRCGYAPCV